MRNSTVHFTAVLLSIAAVLTGLSAAAKTGILNTKHNLSKTGPGSIKALEEDRVCVFCHTPHNANPQTPLWNKNIEGVNYELFTPYSSSTLRLPGKMAPRPTGSSRLCLSCHDGTIALGDLNKPAAPVSMTVLGGIPQSSPAHFGTSLENHHPFSFSYYDSLPNPQLSPTLPPELLFYGYGIVQCSTCHDAHDNANKKFLAVSNENSGLCTLCHIKTGWTVSPHSTSASTWNGTLPNPWPRTGAGTDFNWTTVSQNGCENCHAPHSAVGPKRLLNCYTSSGPCSPATEEGVCFPCHNGNLIDSPPVKDIFAQLQPGKSRHAVDMTVGVHDPTEPIKPDNSHVECVDCHNPHVTNNNKTVSPPLVTGRLDGVPGISIDDSPLSTAANEYEICFRCHANSTAQTLVGYIPVSRVIQEYNTRLEFQTNNPSYHPVAGSNESISVPSLILPLTISSKIYCTDCHSDEGIADGGSGSRGPHGSQYPPILKEQYRTKETEINNIYNSGNFALCYRCHYEASILSDTTFQKRMGRGGHSGHLQFIIDSAGAVHNVYTSCATCHDPHGVRDNGISGSHKRLINFSTQSPYTIVSALTGSSSVPVFNGSGNGSGSCTLVCHGVEHRTETHSYP